MKALVVLVCLLGLSIGARLCRYQCAPGMICLDNLDDECKNVDITGYRPTCPHAHFINIDYGCNSDEKCYGGYCLTPNNKPRACQGDHDCWSNFQCQKGECKLRPSNLLKSCEADSQCTTYHICCDGKCIFFDGKGLKDKVCPHPGGKHPTAATIPLDHYVPFCFGVPCEYFWPTTTTTTTTKPKHRAKLGEPCKSDADCEMGLCFMRKCQIF